MGGGDTDRNVGQRELRRRCQAVVDGLELPEPFDIGVLAATLGQRRGRPIRLIAMRLPLAPVCGMWLSTSDFEAIFYEAGTSPLHREHIIAHELGHLLSAHEAPATMSDDVARVLLPDLDPALVRRALNRGNYTTAEEREAEMIASLISRAASRLGRTAGWVCYRRWPTCSPGLRTPWSSVRWLACCGRWGRPSSGSRWATSCGTWAGTRATPPCACCAWRSEPSRWP